MRQGNVAFEDGPVDGEAAPVQQLDSEIVDAGARWSSTRCNSYVALMNSVIAGFLLPTEAR
jgi:hypothetical protein